MKERQKIRVRIETKVDWLEPPKSREQEILRVLANKNLQAIAHLLEAGVATILSELADSYGGVSLANKLRGLGFAERVEKDTQLAMRQVCRNWSGESEPNV